MAKHPENFNITGYQTYQKLFLSSFHLILMIITNLNIPTTGMPPAGPGNRDALLESFWRLGGCRKIHIFLEAAAQRLSKLGCLIWLLGWIPTVRRWPGLIYMELWSTIIQSQLSWTGVPDPGHVARHSVG